MRSDEAGTRLHTLSGLLHEVGVYGKNIKAWIFDGFGSLPIKYHFVKASLVDKRVFDSKR
jgi:hypothetical protein